MCQWLGGKNIKSQHSLYYDSKTHVGSEDFRRLI